MIVSTDKATRKTEAEKIVDEVAGTWKIKGSGVDYVGKLRKEWGKREQRIWSKIKPY